MELAVLVLMVLMVLVLMLRSEAMLPGLLVNTIVGVVLLFLTNLVLIPPIPISLFTVLICAVGGVVGWLVILVLHVLGIAF